jgi:hypothetical protein
MFGRDLTLPIDVVLGAKPDADHSDVGEFKRTLIQRCKEGQQRAVEAIRKAQEKQKKYYDERVREVSFEEGDLVWLHWPVLEERISKKLAKP